nr:hypothetical protein [Tepidiforma sp.]
MQLHAGDDDDVAPAEERARGRVPQLVDLVVDVASFAMYVSVRGM